MIPSRFNCKLFEELPTVIQQHHDGTAANSAITGLPSLPTMCKCEWPPALLARMASIAACCARKESKLRSTLGAVLPELEKLVPDHQSGGSSSCRLRTGL